MRPSPPFFDSSDLTSHPCRTSFFSSLPLLLSLSSATLLQHTSVSPAPTTSYQPPFLDALHLLLSIVGNHCSTISLQTSTTRYRQQNSSLQRSLQPPVQHSTSLSTTTSYSTVNMSVSVSPYPRKCRRRVSAAPSHFLPHLLYRFPRLGYVNLHSSTSLYLELPFALYISSYHLLLALHRQFPWPHHLT